MSKLYQGDIGTVIDVDTSTDLSTAIILELRIKKPSGTEVVWAGALHDTTKIRYTIDAADFDEVGTYQVQAYVALPSWSGWGDTTSFAVYDQYE